MRYGVKGVWVAALAGAACLPSAALAQVAPGGRPGQGAPQDAPPEPTDENDLPPVVPDDQFEASMPVLGDDIDAPLDPISAPAAGRPAAPATNGENVAGAAGETLLTLPVAPQDAPEFSEPLVPLAEFDPTPVKIEGVDDSETVKVRYTVAVEGLRDAGLDDRFGDLSALDDGGEAANAAMVAARAREDEALAVRLMQAMGYYDGTAVASVEQNPDDPTRLKVTLSATPGGVYRLGSVRVDADATVPPGLVDRVLPLKVGDPIEVERIQAAEANVSLKLPQQGYPFVIVGQRDILLDGDTHRGEYVLPVDTGPRASFGGYSTGPATPRGRLAIGADHVGIMARYQRGELYDSRKVDDLREALIATGLFSTVSVEPVRTGEIAPDGTEVIDLRVLQQAGPPRTLAVEAGYSTGQGLRIEGSWTHRNLFPPEGALIVSGVAGTQEQGVTGTFRRSNAGRRDRTFQVSASANRADYDAYESLTGTLAVRWSYDSTPIWQKRWTWYTGAEIVGSNEDQWNYNSGKRDRGTWLIAALPSFVGYDTSDDLLNPTRGFRVKLNVSPETSVRGQARPYARVMLEGTAYYPINDRLVIAGRARAGSIPGVGRNELPPSRRYYAGGGGSVRGFGYQELGPRSPDGKPVGGRSLNEFSIEARYRFGNFGIVPFIDAGQVYEGIYPTGHDIRFGAGIGGRFYTNFGPLRVDLATPIHRKPGESKLALYISIGQAF